MISPEAPSRPSSPFFQNFFLAVTSGALMLMGASCASTSMSSTGPVARPPDLAREDGVRLQLFLDSESFGPGIIDGHEGEYTRKALARYNAAHGYEADAFPNLRGISPYTTYTITEDDLSRLGTMGGQPSVVAQQKSQPYTSPTELLAERFHTSRAFVAKLNPGQNVDTLPPGSEVQVPNVERPFYVSEIPTTSKTSTVRDPALVNRHLLVDLSAKMLELRQGEKLLAAFPITPGSSEHPAPAGEWKIVGITTFPWYRYDKGVLERGERTEDFHNLPPGPNSPVGILWMGLNRPGIGIHGTSTPETIGRSGSHGCIRLSNWDAAAVRTMVTAGVPVTIR